MLKATTNNNEWWDCKKCSHKLAKLFFTPKGVIFEAEGRLGQRIYFDASFLVIDCPKCLQRNVLIQHNGEAKFEAFNQDYLGGEQWAILTNNDTKQKFEARLSDLEKSVLNLFIQKDKSDGDLNLMEWVAQGSQELKTTPSEFFVAWTNIVSKSVDLDYKINIDKKHDGSIIDS